EDGGDPGREACEDVGAPPHGRDVDPGEIGSAFAGPGRVERAATRRARQVDGQRCRGAGQEYGLQRRPGKESALPQGEKRFRKPVDILAVTEAVSETAVDRERREC